MYSKIIIFTLIIYKCFADFMIRLKKKLIKKREDIYFDMNKTLKKARYKYLPRKIQNTMNGLQDRINSYETKVYGGATKKRYLAIFKLL